ncbi:MAG: ABC transporter ATP-binding protein, partial [Brevundimonas sp.]|nr:ABC transporter ATP-binding protein [Brevundimonas sp.]
LEGYDGTLILVSHDRDFIDRLSTSTLALNGRGAIVETPGGWTDFIRQNPGFLQPGVNPRPQDKEAAKRAEANPAPASVAAAPKKPGKMSFKDVHRLKEIEGLLETLPIEIAKQDAILSDPNLYSRDPSAFDKAMKAAEKARTQLEEIELEWLELEEKKAALAG